ncbi:MAG: EAL domain-containing protein [Rhizobiaceae bacterium]|nr:EAL domain-containing protein [Rhizobiaceae bacterium]
MPQAKPIKGSGRLILFIKCAYWMALLIIAAMAMSSYVILQEMLSAQQKDQELLALVNNQKALSQRVVFLANAASAANELEKPGLIERLRGATGEFEKNYDEFLDKTAADPMSPDRFDPSTVDGVLFSKPYHLDYFSTSLAANGWRLISALDSQIDADATDLGYLAGTERARLDETVARATLEGYMALSSRIETLSEARLERLLALHRNLFYVTMVVIALIALLIFRPMSGMIMRRTRDLVSARNSMEYLATHDGLTGLYNRAYLRAHFADMLGQARHRAETLAVIQIDLDRFKQINDLHGHAAGDHVLKATADRMLVACRASDLCVRLGGDEFVVIVSGSGAHQGIEHWARRLLVAINEPIGFNGALIQPGASAGIAVFPGDADTAEDLLVYADLALYAAKKLGGGAYHQFSDDLRRELDRRKDTEAELRLAIARQDFEVYFQPQISLASSATTGVEALMRWVHPERGIVAPGEFLPVAEKCGLMAAIGRIVVTKAIQEAAQWHRDGIDFGRLAVNVSGSELGDESFDQFLFATLASAGLPNDRLALEIVESVILDDEKTGIAGKLRRIRSAGIHLELDDFGTGYASLSHVSRSKIDRLKIDRRFVHNIDANDENAMIVRAIADIARGLGISVVAEGAETAPELDCLSALGCDEVQGYSIAVPMPGTKVRTWLRARSARPGKITVLQGARVSNS